MGQNKGQGLKKGKKKALKPCGLRTFSGGEGARPFKYTAFLPNIYSTSLKIRVGVKKDALIV